MWTTALSAGFYQFLSFFPFYTFRNGHCSSISRHVFDVGTPTGFILRVRQIPPFVYIDVLIMWVFTHQSFPSSRWFRSLAFAQCLFRTHHLFRQSSVVHAACMPEPFDSDFFIMLSMDGVLASSRTLVVGTNRCEGMLRIFLKIRWWNCSILRNWSLRRVQVEGTGSTQPSAHLNFCAFVQLGSAPHPVMQSGMRRASISCASFNFFV